MITKQHISPKYLVSSVTWSLSALFLFTSLTLSAQVNDRVMVLGDTTLTTSQELVSEKQILGSSSDSIAVAQNKKKEKTPLIDSEIKYSAKDSIPFKQNKVYLYGDASVSYKDVLLTAYHIELDLDSSIAYATGTLDSLGVETGLPVFKDKSGEYTMRKMRYNFKTEKAIIEHVVTTQGEGFVVSELAKKNSDNTYFLKDGRYTTCDQHDHPHFYINMTKAKVIPGKKIITGPAYLVIEDVKFYPLIIPFAFVPTTKSYSSGFLMPSYGEESSRGFFLRDGGYYWAANDYFDFALTGDIYANSSWGIRASSKYKVLYKFSGNFSAQKITNIYSEKDLPDYSKTNDFSLSWSHSQDSKANAYSTFSASVNYSTSSYDKNNVGSIINPVVLATNTKRSSVNYSRRFPDKPFSLSGSLQHSQNSRDTTIDLTVPDLTFTVNRLFPFKSKNKVGSNETWYEKISFSYTGNTRNYIHSKESELLDASLAKDWKNGVKHSIPVSMNMKLLKYFTLTPSFNYTERWYFKSISKEYDSDLSKVVDKDTTAGFNRVYDYSLGASTSTKLYTFFKPSRALFGDKIEAIRHVMTPSVSFSYRPDFGDPKYGYYDWFEYYDAKVDEIVKHEYSYYDGAIFGIPGKGESGSLGISLGNTLEMKVKSDKDTTGYKKISILESLNFSTSYNFLADSMKWSKISMSGRTKIFGTSISFGATFDPYVLDTLPMAKNATTNRIVRKNKFEWTENHRIARMESANLSFGFNFGSDTFKKKKEGSETQEQTGGSPENTGHGGPNSDAGSSQPPLTIEEGDVGYVKFDMPWSISINYSMRITQGSQFNIEKMAYPYKFSADINMSGRISLTPKWDINMSSGYNFDRKEISHTNLRIARNLHCWSMSFNMVPFGTYKSYFFSIAVNSSLLRDLKYEKRTNARDNPNWY